MQYGVATLPAALPVQNGCMHTAFCPQAINSPLMTCIDCLCCRSTLGGGTKVNWTVSFRTPDHVRQEWAVQHGLPCFAPGPGPFTDALDAVCSRMGVQTDKHHNAPNVRLLEGLAAIDGKPEAMPRNCLTPEECNSYCALGECVVLPLLHSILQHVSLHVDHDQQMHARLLRELHEIGRDGMTATYVRRNGALAHKVSGAMQLT